MSLSKPSLQALKISKAFISGLVQVQVLQQLSISIYPAELSLIVGPSGCGKSTLLSIISGLQNSDAGQVLALGQDISQSSRKSLERFRLHHTGFIFQGFNLFSALTAYEQVALPLSYLKFTAAEIKRRTHTALEEVGMSHRMQLRQWRAAQPPSAPT